ncbi:MAG: hypothetical protein V3T23_13795 [Nitrososphaerales archaeon]
MAAKVGSFNITTGVATSTIGITGVGFLPTVVIFWWMGRTESVDTEGGADAQPGFGVMVGATKRWAITSIMEDNQDNTDTAHGHSPDGCILEVRENNSIAGRADFSSFDADGFTIIIDTQFVVDFRISYLALDHTSVETGSFVPSATGSLAETGLGFQPGCILFGSTKGTTEAQEDASDGSVCIGAATGSGVTDQWTIGCFGNDSVSSAGQASYGFGGEVICSFTGNNGPQQRISFTSNDADGFTVNVIEKPTTGRTIWWLALAGGEYFVSDRVSTDTNTTGVGFQPEAVLFAGFGKIESVVNDDSADINMSLGAATSATERTSQAFSIDRSADPSEVWTAIEFDQCLLSGDLADNIDGLMDLVSMDSDGFTTVMDNPDDSAFFQGFVAFGVDPSIGEAPFPQIHLW